MPSALGRASGAFMLLLAHQLAPAPALATTEITMDSNMEEIFQPHRYIFIKFYATWCGHCKALAPTWETLGKDYEDSHFVLIASVDCTSDASAICEKFGVTTYPNLRWFAPGDKEGEEYTGERDIFSLRQFASTLRPPCVSSQPENCSWEQRRQLSEYAAMSAAKREAKIAKLNNEVKRAEQKHLSMRRDLQAHATGRWDGSKAKLLELKADVRAKIGMIRASTL